MESSAWTSASKFASARRSLKWFAASMRGALGKIISGEAHYWAGYIDRPAWPDASPVERRLRNWVHDRVLSGDIIVEQNIHAVDVCNWILQGHPLKVVATGGRKERPTEGDDCYGHYNAILYYPDDVTVSFSSAQFMKGGFRR